MRLRDKLAALGPKGSPGTEPGRGAPLVSSALAAELERPERIAALRALIGEVVARGRERVEVRRVEPAELPAGRVVDTPEGPLHLIERWLEPQHRHGRVPVSGALQVTPALLSAVALDPALAAVDPAGLLILDTETTGLAGGAGTVPFLIGLGSFDGGVLKVEQLFLRNLGSEAPLLRHVAERLSQASLLVTYNGKAFDWPLLRARFVMNRVPVPPLPPHLDLLACARRAWKLRLGSVRLTEVETAVLGKVREDDIAGAEIPARYLHYLRGGDPRALLPVLAHNEDDVIALAAVLFRLCAHFERVCAEDDPLDHVAYAKLALRGGDLGRAEAFALAAIQGGGGADVKLQAAWVRARVARLRGDPGAAAAAFHEALACAPCARSASALHLALARLYERQLRDLARAHRHARFTLEVEGPVAHGRRLGRLRRKLERSLEAAAS